MPTIAFVNFKGGVTKTSSVVGLGAALARRKQRVLIVDCDPQGHVSVHVGIDRAALPLGLEDVLGEKSRSAAEIVVKTAEPGLWVAPSRRGLLHARANLAAKPNRDALLARAIKEVSDQFDFVLIDSPPDEGILAVNAMYASQHIIVPTPLDSLSLDGINPLVDTVLALREAYEDRPLALLGVLINKFDERLITENRENEALLREAFGEDNLIFNTRIRVDEDVRKAQRSGKTIFQFNPRAKAALDFDALAGEVLARLGNGA